MLSRKLFHIPLFSISIYVFTFFSFYPLSAQNPVQFIESAEFDIPYIINYSPDQYQAHGQNWAVVQDSAGYIYVANTDGCILQFDGVSWRSISVSNGSIVRSLAVDPSGKIFVGAQDEFGFLAPDSSGNLRYISLVSDIESAYRDFGDVWQLHSGPDGVYFSTKKYLFRYDKSGNIKIWKSETSFHASFMLAGKGLYVHQTETGLMHLQADSLKLIPDWQCFSQDRIYVVLPAKNDQLLIGARKSGLFIFNGAKNIPLRTPVNQWLIENHLYHGCMLSDSSYLFSTTRGGIIGMDQKGKITAVIDKATGIADDKVWFVYEDRSGSVWLALNKGLSQIHYPAPFTFFDQRTGLEGNVQDIVRHRGVIYAATGMGVYRLVPVDYRGKKPYFQLLNGLKSQCWSLLSLPDILLVSSNHGVYEIKQDKFIPITNKSAWQMVRARDDSNRIFLGLDDGVSKLYRGKTGWIDEGRFPALNMEARKMALDSSGDLWVGTVYDGLYRIRLSLSDRMNPQVDHFNVKDGLPSTNYNLVFPGHKDVLFATTYGIYDFDRQERYFKPLKITGDMHQYRSDSTTYTILSVDDKNDIWFNHSNRPVLARYKDDSYYFDFKPFLEIPESSIYTFYPEKSGITWIGGTGGIVRYDNSKDHITNNPVATNIRKVLTKGDSLIFGGSQPVNFRSPVLAYDQNALRFEFALNDYSNVEYNRYRFLLDGFDQEWSDWIAETKKDYTNLQEGNYTFRVQGKNIYGTAGRETKFSFIILPPWYRTIYAYLIYLLMISAMLYISFRYLSVRVKQKAIAERIRNEKIEKAAEEKLRRKVAADFHDELGNLITKISLFSEILKNNYKKDGRDTKTYLKKINENAHKLYDETRDFIWHLDPQKDTLYDLGMRVKLSADELFDGTGINFELEGAAEHLHSVRLTMDWRQHILRICKEALHNALKYARCQNVRIIIEKNSKNISLTIHDDGKGFSVSETTAANGLINMKNRAEAIGGILNIQSGAGSKGTTVQLMLKLPE